MVNGGGAVNLQFQRDPFKPHEHTVVVPWNEIVVVNKITMKIKEDTLPDYRSNVCIEHDYDTMKPVVLATWKHGFQGGCPEKSAILAESQVLESQFVFLCVLYLVLKCIFDLYFFQYAILLLAMHFI